MISIVAGGAVLPPAVRAAHDTVGFMREQERARRAAAAHAPRPADAVIDKVHQAGDACWIKPFLIAPQEELAVRANLASRPLRGLREQSGPRRRGFPWWKAKR